MDISVNTQELQDRTAKDTKSPPLLFADSMGVIYQIIRYKEPNETN